MVTVPVCPAVLGKCTSWPSVSIQESQFVGPMLSAVLPSMISTSIVCGVLYPIAAISACVHCTVTDRSTPCEPSGT